MDVLFNNLFSNMLLNNYVSHEEFNSQLGVELLVSL